MATSPHPILSASLVLLFDHSGVTASEMNEIRRLIRQAGGRVLVAPNQIMAELLAGTPLETLRQYFRGPTAMVLSDNQALPKVAHAMANAIRWMESYLKPGQRRATMRIRAIWIEGESTSWQELLAWSQSPMAPEALLVPPGPVELEVDAAELEALRDRLRPLLQGPPNDDDDLNGWQPWPLDAAKVLAQTPGLQLQEGWSWCAFAYRESSGGNGVVWAVPFSDPTGIIFSNQDARRSLFAPPRPNLAKSVAEVLRGRCEPRTLLHASILLRELSEFAADWHGVSWGAHEIVDRLPERDWKWSEALVKGEASQNWRGKLKKLEPTDLRPRVVRTNDGGHLVIFYTFTELETVRLVGHVDHFPSGAVVPSKVERATCATAGSGYIH
jgi:ribosomal protein L10